MACKNNELEKLRSQLVKLHGMAPHGSHVKVSKNLNISVEYLGQIKRGANATLDNDRNRKLLKDIIAQYKSIINEKMMEFMTLKH